MRVGAAARGLLLPLVLIGCAPAAPVRREPLPPPPDPFTAIDSHALASPPVEADTLERLASRLVQPAQSDLEKARVIFRWIAQNINYDLDAARLGNGGGSAEEALRNRTAVCGGFSDLFVRLAEAAGLEAVGISGWARGMGYSVGDPVGGPPNHAWNAVKVEGRWLLVDCTWAAGAVDETGQFVRRFEPWFFAPPPEAILYTHLPTDPRWQLRNAPIDATTFARMPYLRSNFFARGLGLISPETCVIPVGEAAARVVLVKPEGAFVIAKVCGDGAASEERRVKVTGKGERAVVNVPAPDGEQYTLRIYSGDASTTEGNVRHYEWVADFKVVRAETAAKPGERPPPPAR
jgi:transglutaminase/protease-like cytokinesis protein 3